MSSLAPSSRSKRSKASRISKKDRDLEMLAVMAPAIQKRTAENRDFEELQFNVLVSRLIGGFNLLLALLLFIVCAVLFSIACCGDGTKYDKGEWEEECETEADRISDNGNGQWSCYHKHVGIVVCLCFALYLLIVGITIMVGAEIFYGTGQAESRSEQELENIAAELKAQKLHDRLDERAVIREEREEREERRLARQERRASREMAPAPMPKQRPGPTNRYAGALPYQGGLQPRARSVGAPSTIAYQTYQTGAPITYRVQAQPQTQYVYGNSRAVSPSRIQIRTSREQVAPRSPASPLRIRVSGATAQPAPSSPGRRTVINM